MEGLEARQLLAGDGLTATYFLGSDLTRPVVSRVESQIDFNWVDAAPDAGLTRESFSVRWSGQVMAPSTGPFTFHVNADEGARLLVDGQALVDWSGSPGERSGTISLQKGIEYRITLEYVQTGGPASCTLSWSSPTLPREVIPQSALDSGEPGRGLTATYFRGEDLSQ
ncbi:MAG: PA14 domain-containing protein, partial [Isosphaeraceae bacterium]